MNGELIWVLSLLAIAVVLFATGKVRMDAIALMVIVAFVLSGTLTLNEAFSGFSDPNVILIAALFIIGDGLVRTGWPPRWGVAGECGGQQRNQDAGLPDAHRRRAGCVYEFNRGGRHFHSGSAQRVGADEYLSLAADDAAELCRTYQRDDDPGRNAPNLVVNSELLREGLHGFSFSASRRLAWWC